jgi:hypothetical protein
MGGGGSSIEETKEQKAYADVAMQKWNKYKAMHKPVQDKYMNSVDRRNSQQSYNQVSGIASVPVENQFTQAVTNTAGALASRGVNPNSGMFKEELNKLDRRKQQTKADIMNQAQVSQQGRYTSGLQGIVAMGQGQEAQASAGLGDIASMANQKAANDAQVDSQNRYGLQQVAGGLVGAGTRYGLNQIDQIGGSKK